jgi:aminoglycoside phosphotransferase (APT) family kinase protein
LILGVPDWRLDKFPKLYDHIIKQEEFLKADGMIDKELQILRDLSPQILEQCELLTKFQIPETLVQSDFHSNNILFDSNTQKMTFMDLGETVITHPFFSLHTFLRQAIIHHGVQERDQIYCQLQESCFENWVELSKNQLLEGFGLAKKLWPIYSALGAYRLMSGIDLQAFKAYYADRPHRLVGYFREYISSI